MGRVAHTITIVGCGPGSPDYVTPAARAAVTKADVLVGAERLLELFPDVGRERIPVAARVMEALDQLDRWEVSANVAVLVTGDPGLFSLSRLVVERFGRDRCSIVPGVSSMQVAFARVGLDWANARILSAHKDNPVVPPSVALDEKIAVFCGREGSLEWIARNLLKAEAEDRRIFVLENLTLHDERIREVTAHELARVKAGSRTIVLIVQAELFR